MRKIKRGKSFAGVVRYALQPGAHHKSDPVVIGGNMLGGSTLKLITEFDGTKQLRGDAPNYAPSAPWISTDGLGQWRTPERLLLLILKDFLDFVGRLRKVEWCRRPDSNRHVSLRLILNQLRLPISPLRH